MAKDKALKVVEAKLAQLKRLPLPGDSGPYSAAQLASAETKLGRPLEPTHREMLAHVGGTFTFVDGAADVGTSGTNVAAFFGLGSDDYNIVEWFEGARDKLAANCYPFAQDPDGDLYFLDRDNRVRFVKLEEGFWDSEKRPNEPAGTVINESFFGFIESLKLPSWAS